MLLNDVEGSSSQRSWSAWKWDCWAVPKRQWPASNLCPVTSQKSEGFNYTAAEVWYLDCDCEVRLHVVGVQGNPSNSTLVENWDFWSVKSIFFTSL